MLRNILCFLAMCTCSVAQAEWQNIGQAGFPRYETSTVLYNGKLIVFNGFSPSVKLQNSVEEYDPRTNTWTLLNDTDIGLANAVTHAGTVLYEDEVWLVGGRIGHHPGIVSNKIWIYSIKNNNWRRGPDLPAPFASGGAAVINHKLHVIGGLDSNAACDVDHHFVYDIKGNTGWSDITDSAAMPMARNHFSTVVFQNNIYTLGGQNNHDVCGNEPTVEVDHAHVYYPLENRWQRLADLPFPRSHSEPASFLYNNTIFIVGGKTQAKKVLSYKPLLNEWTEEKWLELPEYIMAPSARIIGNQFIVALGGSPVTNAKTSTRVMQLPDSFLEGYQGDIIPTPTEKTIWSDSYSVDGQCYCDTTYDHQIANIEYSTPAGIKTIKQVCNAVNQIHGEGRATGRTYYNTVQCGFGPTNLDKISDEWVCPGIPRRPGNYTGYRCFERGALWNLDTVYDSETHTVITHPASDDMTISGNSDLRGAVSNESGSPARNISYLLIDTHSNQTINREGVEVAESFIPVSDISSGAVTTHWALPQSLNDGRYRLLIKAVDAHGNSSINDRAFTIDSSLVHMCNGLPATVMIANGQTPTNGNDVIVGTSGSDTINGLGGHDTICGLDGTDTINGGDGSDWIDGGNGEDNINGDAGSDRLYGGYGRDVLAGGTGHDRLHGQGGNDTLYGDDGNDKLYGGLGNDRLYGGNDDDRIWGESGIDFILGGNGDDSFLSGGDGNDKVYGQSGNDTVRGGNGADRVYGGPGDDDVRGQSGDDTIIDGGQGNDHCQTAPGNDASAVACES